MAYPVIHSHDLKTRVYIAICAPGTPEKPDQQRGSGMKSLRVFLICILTASISFAGGNNPKGDINTAKAPNPSLRVGSMIASLPQRDEPNETVFLEDFEEGMEGWTTFDLTNPDTAWHISDFNARGEDDLLWWCGDTLSQYEGEPVGYDNVWRQWLDTPALDLSGAGDGLTLTFDGWWLLEDPRIVPRWLGECDGYDGWLVMISEDGGVEFEPLIPESPAYTAERLKAAEVFWGIDQTPGWFFMSIDGEFPDTNRNERRDPEWLECTFDLSDYRSEEVVIRFVLLSDRTVAAPFGNVYLEESGICIDNILITDANEEVYLNNNADDDPVPGELIARRGDGFGDYWARTDASAHESEWAAWNDDDHINVMNALDTPPINMPEGLNLWYEFWVWCNLPDDDSNGDGALDDFYQMYISNDGGETWTYITHDYARAESGGDGWFHYVPGTPWTGNVELDLSDYAGEIIQLRWIFRTDGDDGGGNGNGLFLDDIEIFGTNRNNRDVGMENLHLRYPLMAGMRRDSLTVEVYNYGLRDQNLFYAWWTWGNDEVSDLEPIIPRLSVVADNFIFYNLTDYKDRNIRGWTPPVPGVFNITAYTALGSQTQDEDDDDENMGNDTTRVEDVRVWPPELYELGYDNRTYRYAMNFNQGSGAAARFSPGELGLEEYTIAAMHFRFNGAQNVTSTFRLHVLPEGDDASHPGDEIASFTVDVPVDSCLPNHMTVSLSSVEAVRGLSGDFWIWIEIMRDDSWPQILGDDLIRGEGRYFAFDGNNAAPYNRDLLIHPIIVAGGEAQPNAVALTDTIEFDAVVQEGDETTISFSLYNSGALPLTIRSVSSSHQAFVINWRRQVTLGMSGEVKFDITYSPPTGWQHVGRLIIESDDPNPPVIGLLGRGWLGVSQPNEEMPIEFGLAEPCPNPFNSLTRIEYGIELEGTVKLTVYDLAGREVMQLVNGWMTAGRHTAVLKADDLPNGLYLLKLKSGAKSALRKVALIK